VTNLGFLLITNAVIQRPTLEFMMFSRSFGGTRIAMAGLRRSHPNRIADKCLCGAHTSVAGTGWQCAPCRFL